jgi:hypothetical protein
LEHDTRVPPTQVPAKTSPFKKLNPNIKNNKKLKNFFIEISFCKNPKFKSFCKKHLIIKHQKKHFDKGCFWKKQPIIFL